MKNLKLVSLFSGCGGFDEGFTAVEHPHFKFKLEWANDISPPACNTYSANFGQKMFEGGIEKVDFKSSVFGGGADVVIGGPPCQDFSIVRGPEAERRGTAVSRGKLYCHFVRAVICLQPKAFVFENVPGLMSANRGEAYRAVLEDFSNLTIRWKEIRKCIRKSSGTAPQNYEIIFAGLVDAARLGVPQARKRLIIIGLRKDLLPSRKAGDALRQRVFEALTSGDMPTSKYPLTPIEVFEGAPLPELEGKYKEVMKEYEGTAREVGTLEALEWEANVWRKLTFDAVEDYLATNRINPADKTELDSAFQQHKLLLKELGYYHQPVDELICQDGSSKIPCEAEAVLERMKRIPPSRNHKFVRGTKWEVEGRGISLIYRRIHPLKPSYTVVAYGGGGTWGYHYEKQRSKLTNRERARLQTFPDRFTFRGSSQQVRAQIGEAVPPLMAKRIAECTADTAEEVF